MPPNQAESIAGSAFSVAEAEALVEKHGTQRKAAAAVGIPQSTLHGCLHPTRRRDRYAADAEFRERHREEVRERYYNLTGPKYNALLLRQRRTKALTRINQRKEATSG